MKNFAKRIYLDNCSTSWPKAPKMGRKLCTYIENDCVNLNRTSSSLVIKSFDFMYALRENLSGFYNYPHPECVIFKSGLTEAMNWVIKGLLKKNDHVIITGMEHNAVMRVLVQQNISYSQMPSDKYGVCKISEASLSSLVCSKTKAFIVNEASNVFGSVQNLDKISTFCKKHGLLLIVDSAQASPFIKIDMSSLNVAALCFSGHKGFLGPQGTGGFIIRKDLVSSFVPLEVGGTGSKSDSFDLPNTLPDRFSPGTENLLGLYALSYSVSYVLKHFEELKDKYFCNIKYMYEALSEIDGIRIVGPHLNMKRSNAISVITDSENSNDISFIANRLADNGIETRVGLHCAPLAHKTMGTFSAGTLRFSPGPFTTKKEIDYTSRILQQSVRW